jgi:hypothetical protein
MNSHHMCKTTLQRALIRAHRIHTGPFYELPRERREIPPALRPVRYSKNFRAIVGHCYVCHHNYSKGLLSHINSEQHKQYAREVSADYFFIFLSTSKHIKHI